MVSQANYFRDDVSGDLYGTPLEAIKSEARSRNRNGLIDEMCRAMR